MATRSGLHIPVLALNSVAKAVSVSLPAFYNPLHALSALEHLVWGVHQLVHVICSKRAACYQLQRQMDETMHLSKWLKIAPVLCCATTYRLYERNVAGASFALLCML